MPTSSTSKKSGKQQFHRYFNVDAFDRRAPFWVIYHQPRGAPPQLRPRYEKLKCPGCNRVDMLRALKSGLDSDVSPPPKFPDIGWCDDHLLVVSEPAREAIDSVPGVKAHYFQLALATNYFVLYPKVVFEPPPSTRQYEPDEPPEPGDTFQIRKGPCKVCGRNLEATWIRDWYEIPKRVPLAGIVIERARSCPLTLVIDDQVQAALKSARITGWRTLAIRGCALDPPEAKIPPDPARLKLQYSDRKAWLARQRKSAGKKAGGGQVPSKRPSKRLRSR